jgi:hypothetical protein
MKCTRRVLIYTLSAVALAFSMGGLRATAAILLSSPLYTENFDEPKLAGASVTGVWTTGKAAVPGTSGWEGVRAGGSGSSMNYTVDAGAGNSGAIYSYGSGGTAERALGAVSSGTNIPAFGVELTNGLSGAITAVSIAYKGEFWRSSTTTQNVLTFGYIVGPAGSTTYLTDPATGFVTLNLTGPLPVVANGALDGNAVGNFAPFAGVLPVSVPVGQSLYLRWTDANDAGNDAGLAVDDFSLTATVVPEPTTVGLALCGMLGLFHRRRLA